MTTEKAMFGAGCFWGVEELFRQQAGVLKTQVGYAGGRLVNPTYEQVCSGATGHVEVVEIDYDPEKISYDTLLGLFWNNHNPTTLNRQGWDVGEQYRSVIFYHTPAQERMARASKDAFQASGKYRQPVVTAIEPAPVFYPAEEYHQQYIAKRGGAGCSLH